MGEGLKTRMANDVLEDWPDLDVQGGQRDDHIAATSKKEKEKKVQVQDLILHRVGPPTQTPEPG